jgi:N-acyl-D-aspartate/D-glutamate deacylase
MAFDTVIKGGLVVDGTGAAPFAADVAVTADRIVEVGPNLDGDRVLDAGGAIVAPGFIDIHTHYDAQVFWDPCLTPSCFHGVTTVFAGNCGFSIAPVRPEHHELVARTLENVEDMDFAVLMDGVPWDFETFADYLASVERRQPALNFGAFVGHSAVRMAVIGDDAYERAATGAEIEEMRNVVRAAMSAGAVGFSTSYAPVHLGADGKAVPSRFGDTEEFEALTAVLAEMGRGVIEVAGSPYPGGLYDFQRRNGRPVTTPMLASPRVSAQITKHLDEWRAGSNLWPQVTPRPLTMGLTAAQPYILNSMEAMGELVNVSAHERLAAYSNPAWRERLRSEVASASPELDWSGVRLTGSASHPELVDRPLADLGAERGCDPIDVLIDVAVDDVLETSFQIVVGNGDPDGVAALLQTDGMTLGLSDAGAHLGQLCDAAQGTHLLARYVRDRDTLSVEKAVRMLSGLQADLFGLQDRGYLRAGALADIAVIDLDRVEPGPVRRVADLPGGASRLTADQPDGVVHVMVNGVPIVSDNEPLLDALDQRPGQVLSAADLG